MAKVTSYSTPKAYSKKELALLYFPTSTPRSAVNHLMAWIKQDPELLERLSATGYKPTSKMLTPRQVQLIVEEFGEP